MVKFTQISTSPLAETVSFTFLQLKRDVLTVRDVNQFTSSRVYGFTSWLMSLRGYELRIIGYEKWGDLMTFLFSGFLYEG